MHFRKAFEAALHPTVLAGARKSASTVAAGWIVVTCQLGHVSAWQRSAGYFTLPLTADGFQDTRNTNGAEEFPLHSL